MGSSFLDLLFPKRCAGCRRLGSYVCQRCRDSQKLHFPQICPVCERPAVDGKTHPGCRSPFSLDGATFVFVYQSPIALLLKQLKYRFGRDLKNLLTFWLTGELKKLHFSFLNDKPTLVPIPLHRLRSNWRGFNQAALLGEDIAKRMKWGYNSDLLIRTKVRRPQSMLVEKERKKNVRGIFTINPNYPLRYIANRPFILFDDVWTTGATMKEVAKVLKRRRVKFIWALAIAR